MADVIVLDGPIGVGKTTLGRSAAQALNAGFVDGDDHADPARPWFCSSLRTSRGIATAGLAALTLHKQVVIAYPMRCTNWLYLVRMFGRAGYTTAPIGLHAPIEIIVAPQRGRTFSPREQARIHVMIAEGYGRRPFSHAVIDTSAVSFPDTVAKLVATVTRLRS